MLSIAVLYVLNDKTYYPYFQIWCFTNTWSYWFCLHSGANWWLL